MRCEFPIMTLHNAFQAAQRQTHEPKGGNQPRHADGVSIYEFENQMVISLDVPGLPEDQLDVNLENGRLTVLGQRTVELPEGAKPIYRNSAQGNFQRSVRIDDSFDPNSVDAVLVNGVLTISLTRRPELQPRKVTVRPAS